MVFSFFRKRTQKEINSKFEEINSGLKKSFSHIKKDMAHVSGWVNHFKGKHDDHESQFRILLNRINRLENMMLDLTAGETEEVKEEIEEEVEEEMGIEEGVWDSLTLTQQKILWKLARLQKELPDQWISLKYLAQEMYPDKEYAAVRSTLSQFISQLEEFGFIKRKRKGKLAYVSSTKKNPALKKKKKQLMILEE